MCDNCEGIPLRLWLTALIRLANISSAFHLEKAEIFIVHSKVCFKLEYKLAWDII